MAKHQVTADVDNALYEAALAVARDRGIADDDVLEAALHAMVINAALHHPGVAKRERTSEAEATALALSALAEVRAAHPNRR